MASSRHGNEQYRWQEALLARLKDLYGSAASFKLTQAEYLERRTKIWAEEPRLTRETRAYVQGYMRALEEIRMRSFFHVRRIIGRPETATSAHWDLMTEEMREACRAGGRTETCLAWDENGACPYGPWTKE